MGVVDSLEDGTRFLRAIRGTENPNAFVIPVEAPNWTLRDDSADDTREVMFAVRIIGGGGQPIPQRADDYASAAELTNSKGIRWRGRPTVWIGGSRIHSASVAGIVVAAFGTFVFGLYLRRWVKERGGGDTV